MVDGTSNVSALAVVLEQERQHLLDEERVSARSLDDTLARLLLEIGTGQVVEERRALGVREGLEPNGGRIGLSPAPLRADIEQLRSGDADEEDAVRRSSSRRRGRRGRETSARPSGCRRRRARAAGGGRAPRRTCEPPETSPPHCSAGPRGRRPRRAAVRRAPHRRLRRASAASSREIFARRGSVVERRSVANASRTGQYVIPSPYGRHRPRATSASSETSSTNSRTRRDFPTPGAPMIVKSWQDLSPSACSNAS